MQETFRNAVMNVKFPKPFFVFLLLSSACSAPSLTQTKHLFIRIASIWQSCTNLSDETKWEKNTVLFIKKLQANVCRVLITEQNHKQ